MREASGRYNSSLRTTSWAQSQFGTRSETCCIDFQIGSICRASVSFRVPHPSMPLVELLEMRRTRLTPRQMYDGCPSLGGVHRLLPDFRQSSVGSLGVVPGALWIHEASARPGLLQAWCERQVCRCPPSPRSARVASFIEDAWRLWRGQVSPEARGGTMDGSRGSRPGLGHRMRHRGPLLRGRRSRRSRTCLAPPTGSRHPQSMSSQHRTPMAPRPNHFLLERLLRHNSERPWLLTSGSSRMRVQRT